MLRRRRNRARGSRDAGLQSELAALADGALDPDAAERALRRVQRQPGLERELADQQRIAGVLHRADISAPPHLRRRVQEMALSAPIAPGGAQRRARLGAGLALAGALAAAAVVLVLLVGGAAGPTVAEAAALGLRAPIGAAPGASADGHHLAVEVQGLAFPDWWPGWRAVGARTDRLGGRWARTVVYVDGRGRRVGYVIVAGPPLPRLTSSLQTGVGVAYSARLRSGVATVSWRQSGHTCVLVSRSVDAATLIGLASGPQLLSSYLR